MLEESADKLEGRKTHGPVRAALGVGVSEEHSLVIHGDNSMV